MLQESGIFQFETRKSVTPKGYGPEADVKIPEEFRLEPIVFREIKGIFAFLVIGLGSASVVLIIEIIVFIIRTKNIWIVYTNREEEDESFARSNLLNCNWAKIFGYFTRNIRRVIRKNIVSIQN